MIDRDFKNAVEINDIDLVRMMLKDSLMIDPTGTFLMNYSIMLKID